ncbi:MAG: hypothetical protein NT020_07935 [Chloroflexales bacterium]|nr:hypothetical protein [Chloroflexales bacterium]
MIINEVIEQLFNKYTKITFTSIKLMLQYRSITLWTLFIESFLPKSSTDRLLAPLVSPGFTPLVA